MIRSARHYAVSGGLLLAAAIACQHLAPGLPDFLTGVLYGLAIGLLFAAVVRAFRPEGCDEVSPAVRRRYLREFLPAMVGYVAAVFLSVWLLKRVDAPALRALIALLPVPAIALAMRAIVRRIRDADELLYGDEFRAFADAHPDHFRYVPCLSREPSPAPHPDERHGYVQQFLGEFGPDGADDVAYLCGNPNMVDACFEALKDAGLAVPQIRREKYVSSK